MLLLLQILLLFLLFLLLLFRVNVQNNEVIRRACGGTADSSQWCLLPVDLIQDSILDSSYAAQAQVLVAAFPAAREVARCYRLQNRKYCYVAGEAVCVRLQSGVPLQSIIWSVAHDEQPCSCQDRSAQQRRPRLGLAVLFRE